MAESGIELFETGLLSQSTPKVAPRTRLGHGDAAGEGNNYVSYNLINLSPFEPNRHILSGRRTVFACLKATFTQIEAQ